MKTKTKRSEEIGQAIETCDLSKELRTAKEGVKLIRLHVFDTINVPFPIVRRMHDCLIDAEKSIDAAAITLTKS